ncbi:MAG: DUF3299 domain-containing protein [Pseudomonadota bacterium]
MRASLSALTFATILVTAACGGAANSEPSPAGPETESTTLAEAGAAAAKEQAAVNARGARELGWEELMPEGEEEKLFELYQQQMAMLYSGGIVEGSPQDVAKQFGTFNTVPELDGVKVRIPGYTVPFDFGPDAEIREFLLVPYFGACLHAPPPPPNQTVFVETEDAITIKDLAMAVWIEGTLRTQRQDTDLAGAAYTIEMHRIEEYEY